MINWRWYWMSWWSLLLHFSPFKEKVKILGQIEIQRMNWINRLYLPDKWGSFCHLELHDFIKLYSITTHRPWEKRTNLSSVLSLSFFTTIFHTCAVPWSERNLDSYFVFAKTFLLLRFLFLKTPFSKYSKLPLSIKLKIFANAHT